MSVTTKEPRIYTTSVPAGKTVEWFDQQEKMFGNAVAAAAANRVHYSTYYNHRRDAYVKAGREIQKRTRVNPNENVTVTQELRLVDGVPTLFTTRTVTITKANTTTQPLPTIKDVLAFAEKNPNVARAFVGK